ncbi:hypothetical protein AVEN_257641-1, partial [Araneus ventricosus]
MFSCRVLALSREEDGQVCGVWCHPAAHQRGDQGRGEGRSLPRAVHMPTR